MLTLLAAGAFAATPILGIELHPLARGDLAWIDARQETGTLVGELDGFLVPALRPFAGAWAGRVAGVGSLGLARIGTVNATDAETRSRSWLVVRPSAEARVALVDRADAAATPWLAVGGHVDLAVVTDRSDARTDAEQEAAAADAAEDRGRLGGGGARLGVGADFPLRPGLWIGLSWFAGLHRSAVRSDERATVSTWLVSDGALTLTFAWPRGNERGSRDR